MKNRSFCNLVGRPPAIKVCLCPCLCVGLCLLVSVCPALAGDAPSWMHAAAFAPLPAHDDKTDAVLLYSEHAVTVQSLDKIRTRVRVAYKILRPSGREYGIVA